MSEKVVELTHVKIHFVQIPCRTAMRGSFPLNGTYFQVNEVRKILCSSYYSFTCLIDRIKTFAHHIKVFADHDSSLNPIEVPRSWLWNLPRRTVYFGTSIPTIFRGTTTESVILVYEISEF